MSVVKIRAALESALAGMTPALATSYENAAFVPVAGTPYQKPFLLTATPDNSTMGDGYYRERGLFQVSLLYPIQAGSAAAAAQAVLIQSLFKRGSTFSNGGIKVLITSTPGISAGQIDGDRWSLPIKISWQSEIFS